VYPRSAMLFIENQQPRRYSAKRRVELPTSSKEESLAETVCARVLSSL
jgi:hypothetical protein